MTTKSERLIGFAKSPSQSSRTGVRFARLLMILIVVFCFRLNTNVELCQSLKKLLDNPDIVAQLDADTR